MGSTTTCEMTTLSSLELMLLKLQQSEESPEKSPPALPSRPVAKLRRRARKKVPMVKFQKSDFDFDFDSVHQHDPCDFNKDVEDEEESKSEGVVIIQRCYRGYQACRYYLELKRGVIALQSFVRGENARNSYQCFVRRLRAVVIIQKHIKDRRKRIEQLTTVICLQAGIRGWLARRDFAKQIASRETEKCELTKVPRIVLLDLGRKVLITEAALERKKDENASLKKRIAEIEKKWMQYEAKMQNMEKMWQDQLTFIQESLAEARRRLSAAENGSSKLHGRITLSYMFNSDRFQENGGSDSQCKTTLDNHAENSTRIQSREEVSNHIPEDDLAKLNLRFKAWKRDYKNRLKEAKATMKKLGRPDRVKSSKIWCGR